MAAHKDNNKHLGPLQDIQVIQYFLLLLIID